jgi:hypothetical protein
LVLGKLSRVLSEYNSTERTPSEIRVNSDSEIASALYWTGPSPVFLLPPRLAVMQGGHAYNVGHPFVQALSEGPVALERFYKDCVPAGLAEMYKITSRGLAGETLPPWELPWLTRTRGPPGAEGGLGLEHGVSYYGPCSPEKIELEHQRLTSLATKIRRRGYVPHKFGYIEGHFLRCGEEFRFFVRGGKHRAAVLTYLGYGSIPVRVRQSWPRVVELSREQEWPLVASGEIDANLAVQIFVRYFRREN